MSTGIRMVWIAVLGVVVGVSGPVFADPDPHALPVGTSNQEYLRDMTKTFAAEASGILGAQGTTPDGEPVIIAVIGDGVDLTHEDLALKVKWADGTLLPHKTF